MSRGVLYLLGAAFFFSVMAVLVKVAGRSLPVGELVLARGVVTLIASYVWLRAARVRPWGNARGLLLLRGLLGFVALSCYYLAVTRLPLAEVTVIHFLNPIVAAFLAALLLREAVGRSLLAGIALSFAGVLLVARPGSIFGQAAASLDPLGVAAALGGAVTAAGAYVCVRRLHVTDHALVIVFYFPLVSVPASIPLALLDLVWPDAIELALLLGIGIATQIAQVLLTFGLGLVATGRGTAIGYAQIVFAVAWGLLFFGERPNAWMIAGAVSIVGGTMLIALTTGHD